MKEILIHPHRFENATCSAAVETYSAYKSSTLSSFGLSSMLLMLHLFSFNVIVLILAHMLMISRYLNTEYVARLLINVMVCNSNFDCELLTFQDGFNYNQGPAFGGKNQFGNFPPGGDMFFQVFKIIPVLFQFVVVGCSFLSISKVGEKEGKVVPAN